MILESLKRRELPEVLILNNGEIVKNKEMWTKRRAEIMELLRKEIYGFSPAPPQKVTYVLEKRNEDAFAGKAVHSVISVHFDTPKGEFSFKFNLITPKKTSPVPLFLHIAFRPDIPDQYYPVEEILDEGFATASFDYNEVVPDTDDSFAEGLGVMYGNSRRQSDEWGKIAMWAWAAQRVMDYLQTLKEIDRERIAVVGHSRLGKTALWCAAEDERFYMAISNDSGCSGAAITRDKKGERVKHITGNFEYWFCENYKKYIDNEKIMPFDQHFLLSAIAPRYLYVASAKEDEWADPQSEFLSCAAVSDVYKLLGLKGLVTPEEFPEAGTALQEGEIAYHMREGTHYLSRYDWQRFMEYMKKVK